VGVDVHKNSYAVTILDEEGRDKHFTMASDPLSLVKKLALTGCVVKQVVYEAGPCGFGLYRLLISHGFPATIVVPTRMPRPITRIGKTDSLDSHKLAEYAFRDMLAPIRIPTEAEEGVRHLQRRRHKLTDKLRKNKQEIKTLLLENHIEEPDGLEYWSKESINALKDLKAVGNTLTAQQNQEIANLQSVLGVGQVVARTFVTEIFQPEKFPDSSHLASFLGLAPILRQSGQSKATENIVPNGQNRLRSILIEYAWKHKSKNAQPEALYRRVLSRSGLAQKAITSVARRLGILLWKLLI